jgi:hypothetical protein
MKLKAIKQIELVDIGWEEYDLIILASGFEARGCHLVKLIPSHAYGNCVVLGFFDDKNKLSRNANDEEYKNRGLSIIEFPSSGGYESFLRNILEDGVATKKGDKFRVLVDYSVMTREWYAYILTWMSYSRSAKPATVDFVYAVGSYQGDFEPMHIQSIGSIAGFEGVCAGPRSTAAFFGLGYDGNATLAVNELIEPDEITCLITDHGDVDHNESKVEKSNKEIIRLSGKAALRIPLAQIHEIFRALHGIFDAVPNDYQTIAVPMGPKPHVLATMLVALLLPKVTVLHARGSRDNPVDVYATGELSISRCSFEVQ